jgi:hypothetical protein
LHVVLADYYSDSFFMNKFKNLSPCAKIRTIGHRLAQAFPILQTTRFDGTAAVNALLARLSQEQR